MADETQAIDDRDSLTARGPSIDPEDVARFSRIAAEWWDPRGKFAPLHRFNPVRLAFIRDQALVRFGRDGDAPRPFEGLRLLDIGGGRIRCDADNVSRPRSDIVVRPVARSAAQPSIDE